MEINEALSTVTADQLSSTMHADADAGENGSEESGAFPDYLKKNYPEIYEFIMDASVEMSFDTEEQFVHFRLGAAFAAAAICRNIDRLSLPSID